MENSFIFLQFLVPLKTSWLLSLVNAESHKQLLTKNKKYLSRQGSIFQFFFSCDFMVRRLCTFSFQRYSLLVKLFRMKLQISISRKQRIKKELYVSFSCDLFCSYKFLSSSFRTVVSVAFLFAVLKLQMIMRSKSWFVVPLVLFDYYCSQTNIPMVPACSTFTYSGTHLSFETKLPGNWRSLLVSRFSSALLKKVKKTFLPVPFAIILKSKDFFVFADKEPATVNKPLEVRRYLLFFW